MFYCAFDTLKWFQTPCFHTLCLERGGPVNTTMTMTYPKYTQYFIGTQSKVYLVLGKSNAVVFTPYHWSQLLYGEMGTIGHHDWQVDWHTHGKQWHMYSPPETPLPNQKFFNRIFPHLQKFFHKNILHDARILSYLTENYKKSNLIMGKFLSIRALSTHP